ncbi:hypothetical protein [Phreatobacter sp.]|uniref:hypothetical protein n=1 Tax=Phreatobacter sp. TaxID=1966341 RepID=UPI003F6F3C17
MSKLISLKSLALAATLAIGLSAAMTGLAEARGGGGGGGGGDHMLTIVTPDLPNLPVPVRNVVPQNPATTSMLCASERPTLRRECERRLRY